MNPLSSATMTEVRDKGATVAVLPIGSFEQHGAHLPLTTDTLVASGIAAALASAYRLHRLPPVTIACSHEHAAWPGTVSLSASTLISVVTDIARSLERSGIDKLVLVNGHGGNYVLSNIVQEANVDGPRMALFPRGQDWQSARQAAGLESSAHDDMHAGELETALLLHLCPEQVRDGFEEADHVADRPHLLVHGMAPYTDSGVIGRPSLGTAEKGAAVLESLTSSFAETLEALTTPHTAQR